MSGSELPVLKGFVVGVHDGDTITILTAEKKEVKVRLEGIDAPELKQPFGQRSKAELSEIVFGKEVSVRVHGKDRYKRTIGRITYGLTDVNLEMVKRGMAWRYEKYSKEPALIEAQAQAKTKTLGFWAEKEQLPPWEWRAKKLLKTKGVKSTAVCVHENCGEGYIWGNAGSGRELPPVRASKLPKENNSRDNCVFVLVRTHIDSQTRDDLNRCQERCVEEMTNTNTPIQNFTNKMSS